MVHGDTGGIKGEHKSRGADGSVEKRHEKYGEHMGYKEDHGVYHGVKWYMEVRHGGVQATHEGAEGTHGLQRRHMNDTGDSRECRRNTQVSLGTHSG